jgi:hypothetical protein
MSFYCEHLGDWPVAAGIPLCQFKRLMASSDFEHLRVLWRAQERRLTGKQVHSRRIAMRAAGIPARHVAPAPFVTGLDLKAIGLKEGPALGRVLRQIYEAQLNEAISTRRQALAMARHLSGDQRNA